jgi:hypothetical protein
MLTPVDSPADLNLDMVADARVLIFINYAGPLWTNQSIVRLFKEV